MEATELLRLHGVPHPAAQVRQAGFPLDHAYVEQCWAPVIGPTSVLLLRRLPALWRDAMPAEIEVGELAASLGLGRSTGRNGSLQRTLDRLVRYRFATRPVGGELEVFTEAPPLPGRQLERLPEWTRGRHDRLLADHLDSLARLHTEVPKPSDLSARLQHMTRPNPTPPAARALQR